MTRWSAMEIRCTKHQTWIVWLGEVILLIGLIARPVFVPQRAVRCGPGGTRFITGCWRIAISITLRWRNCWTLKCYYTPAYRKSDIDEYYNLNEDPGELRNLVESQEAQEKVTALRELLTQEAEKSRDPLCNAICKYFGQWFRNPDFQIQTSTI